MYLLHKLLFAFIYTPSGILTLHTSSKPDAKLNYTSVVAEVGSTAWLPCKYAGDLSEVGWFRMKDLQLISNSDFQPHTDAPTDDFETCALIIENVNSTHAGFYRFTSWNHESKEEKRFQHNMVQLIVEGSVGVDMESVWDAADVVPVVADAGDIVLLPCNISQDKRLWIRLEDSRLFSSEFPGGGSRMTYNENGMEIRDVAQEDAGIYRCETVTDPTSGSFIDLQIKESSQTMSLITASVGETVTLPCNLELRHGYKSAWIFQKLQSVLTIDRFVIARDERFSSIIDQETGTFSLVLRSVRISDAGTYICQTNTDPMEAAFVELNIEDPSVTVSSATVLPITLAPVTAVLGETATLPCLLVRDLHPISWSRERDSHILSINDLTLTSDVRIRPFRDPRTQSYLLKIRFVEPEDAGIYKCSLASQPVEVSLVELIINEPETKIEVEVVKRVKIEDTVVITCSIEGTQPPSYVSWYKDQNLIMREQQNIEIVTEAHKSTLTINKATVDHSGKYTCTPSNAPSSTTNLQVTG